MKAVLLINLGTPDQPELPDVKRYLKEFLNDGRVIDYPKLKRTLLVNGIIIPARAKNSTELYKKLWTDKGSPLLYHTKEVTENLQQLMGSEYLVEFAMRYQNPSIESILSKWEKLPIEEIVVLPLYPQYASSSTGSTAQKVMEVVSKWEVIPTFSIKERFYDNDDYIDCVAEEGEKLNHKDYDKVVFSFHGLPERHMVKSCKVPGCKQSDCISENGPDRRYCYRSSCYETARRLAKKLELSEDDYVVGFQSRLGKDPWIQPFSDEVIADLGKQGHKKILVFSPAFVADCLETTIEISDEYQEIFEENGGEKVQLVPSLNSKESWVKVLHKMVLKSFNVTA